MPHSRLIIVGLTLLGLVLQAVAGQGILAFCIGCERGPGWTVTATQEPPVAKVDCCGNPIEPDPAIDVQPSELGIGHEKTCGCVDVAVPGGLTLQAAGTRAELTDAVAKGLVTMPIYATSTWTLATTLMTNGRARAGPDPAPRLLAPPVRCTVLNL